MKNIFKLLLCFVVFCNCQKPIDNLPDTNLPPAGSPFIDTAISVGIAPGLIDEASGIADSKSNTGSLWVEQDSGNPPDLWLLSYSGIVQKQVHIDGAENRDWEDIAMGDGPVTGENYIYIAETGDNLVHFTDYAIYRFIEPKPDEDTVYNWEKINFQYPDGSHDAEAMLLDNATKDIYIITKRDSLSKIYKLGYPQNTATVITADSVGQFSFTGVVSAAISPDETEMLVKTYSNVYYWKRQPGESILTAFKRAPLTLGYINEPQGEAICFKQDNSGFFTLSEKPSIIPSVSLNEYHRK